MLDKIELRYRNIATFCAFLLILRIFLSFQNPIIDILYEFAKIGTIGFMYLALRKRILLIGLGFITISFNIKLLVNPLIQVQNPAFFTPIVHKFTVSFLIIGIICLIVGVANKTEDSYYTERIQIDNWIVIGLIFSLTVAAQLILRVIW